MYWDVVEVRPESNRSLFVRFRDGKSGRIGLDEGVITGALAPLRDPQFFERVFVDDGVVAWPGEIDLAPDALYQQVGDDEV